MSTIRELADRHWEGEGDLVHEHHPVAPVNHRQAEELLDGVLYVKSIASVSALDTGDGLVMLDTGGWFDVDHVYDAVRGWRATSPLAAAVYSHHHVDHIFGTRRFEEEADSQGWEQPVVYAHEDVPAHFDRYARTTGWNSAINTRQFGFGLTRLEFPGEFRRPRRDVLGLAHLRARRAHLRAPSRARRDRRRHVDVGTGEEDPPPGRPVHLGRAQRGQPAEGAAVPVRLGDRAAGDGGARARDHALGSRPADLRARAHRARARRHRRSARRHRVADARVDEPGQIPRRGASPRRGPGPPAGEALPAARLRPSPVPGPQRVAPLRRLVRR